MTTASAPLVSVVIPTYNRSNYIAETIDSVLSQDYPSVEVVVINDGSTDATREVLQRFGRSIAVTTQPNAGQSASVNRGFATARGDYVTIVNDDDPILAGALSRLVDVLETDLHPLVAYPDFFNIDSKGEQISKISHFDYSLVDMVRYHLCVPGPCSLIRRRAIELVGGWDLRWRWVADYDFWLRIGLHGSMVHVAEPLATWRRHESAATLSAPRLEMAKEQIGVIESFLARPDLPPDVRAVEAEAMATAWAVGFLFVNESFEAPGLSRFRLEDRLAGYIELPTPAARRFGSPLAQATAQAAKLTHLLELADDDRTSLLRRVEVLQRHLALRGGQAADTDIGTNDE